MFAAFREPGSPVQANTPSAELPSIIDRDRDADRSELSDAVEGLLWLGTSMLRAGNTAFRTRECMDLLAKKLSFDAISVALTFDTVIASIRRAGERVTMAREIGLPGVNAWRIGELEKLAQTAELGTNARKTAADLARIESASPLYTRTQIAAAVGAASGAFAFLNGCGATEIWVAAVSSALGQSARSQLARRQFNQYGATALSAVVAAGMYVAIAALSVRAGWGTADHPAGFMSSVLFLVPGFPLVAALLDLLEHQTVAAFSRFAYGIMMFLAATFGLSIIVGIVRIDLSPHPPVELGYSLTMLLKGVASFAGGYGFALLYNSPARTALAVGLLALAANEFRLMLVDAGMALAPATFFGALAIGLVALLLDRRLNVPRITITVPSIIIMVPGVYAFETIVFFNRGQMLEALQTLASCSFVIGAMAMGLATPRFFSKS